MPHLSEKGYRSAARKVDSRELRASLGAFGLAQQNTSWKIVQNFDNGGK